MYTSTLTQPNEWGELTARTYEPIEFERYRAHTQDSMKITDPLTQMYRIFLTLRK